MPKRTRSLLLLCIVAILALGATPALAALPPSFGSGGAAAAADAEGAALGGVAIHADRDPDREEQWQRPQGRADHQGARHDQADQHREREIVAVVVVHEISLAAKRMNSMASWLASTMLLSRSACS